MSERGWTLVDDRGNPAGDWFDTELDAVWALRKEIEHNRRAEHELLIIEWEGDNAVNATMWSDYPDGIIARGCKVYASSTSSASEGSK